MCSNLWGYILCSNSTETNWFVGKSDSLNVKIVQDDVIYIYTVYPVIFIGPNYLIFHPLMPVYTILITKIFYILSVVQNFKRDIMNMAIIKKIKVLA